MTLKEFLEKAGSSQPKPKRHLNDEEHRLQVACVRWFKYQYPKLDHVLIAVPNGGRRDSVTGAKLKAEGALAGAADLLLLKSNRYYGFMAIEMKTKTGRQSEEQKKFEQSVNEHGGTYKVVRSIDEFVKVITNYIKDSD